MSNDERRRRGIYQAEWAGKLPWDPPGLDQGLPFIEVELRSSNPSLGSVRPSQQEPQVTIEDLEALERVLDDIQDNLTPEDNPASTNQHPVQIAVSLIKKLRKNIEKLSADFEKLNRSMSFPVRMCLSAEASFHRARRSRSESDNIRQRLRQRE